MDTCTLGMVTGMDAMGTYLQGVKRFLVPCLHLCQFSLYSLHLRFHLAPLLCVRYPYFVAVFTQILVLTLSIKDLTTIKWLHIFT